MRFDGCQPGGHQVFIGMAQPLVFPVVARLTPHPVNYGCLISSRRLGPASEEVCTDRTTQRGSGGNVLPCIATMEAPIESSWEDYGRRRRRFLMSSASLVIFFPAVIVLQHLVPQMLPILTFAILFLCWIITGSWMMVWRCPRCAKPFFYTWWATNSFARRCMHCGLNKWEEPAKDG
jgi:hypothetical protein